MIIDVYFGDKKLPWYIDTELKSMSDATVKLTIKTTIKKSCRTLKDLKVGDYFTWTNRETPWFINLKINATEFLCVWDEGKNKARIHDFVDYYNREVIKLNLKELVFEREV